jgi:hypothetical protein
MKTTSQPKLDFLFLLEYHLDNILNKFGAK